MNIFLNQNEAKERKQASNDLNTQQQQNKPAVKQLHKKVITISLTYSLPNVSNHKHLNKQTNKKKDKKFCQMSN